MDEYTPEDDSPEARLFRQDARADAQRAATARWLILSLHPGDSRRDLFSWATIKQWCLKRR